MKRIRPAREGKYREKFFSFHRPDSDLYVPYDRYPVEVSDAVIGRKKKKEKKRMKKKGKKKEKTRTKEKRRFELGGGRGRNERELEEGRESETKQRQRETGRRQGETIVVERRIK